MRIPLDNNATERAIRGPVVGRKDHYGSKSRRGTEVAATLYTVLETLKLHRKEPAAYLHAAVLARITAASCCPVNSPRRIEPGGWERPATRAMRRQDGAPRELTIKLGMWRIR